MRTYSAAKGRRPEHLLALCLHDDGYWKNRQVHRWRRCYSDIHRSEESSASQWRCGKFSTKSCSSVQNGCRSTIHFQCSESVVSLYSELNHGRVLCLGAITSTYDKSPNAKEAMHKSTGKSVGRKRVEAPEGLLGRPSGLSEGGDGWLKGVKISDVSGVPAWPSQSM